LGSTGAFSTTGGSISSAPAGGELKELEKSLRPESVPKRSLGFLTIFFK
jgi:hypothetical protein